MNKLIAGTAFDDKPLETIIRESARKPEHQKIFNNAAQVWNHTVQWNCMAPGGGGAPPKDIASEIDRDFGGLDAFKKKFKQAAVDRFDSGYAWLIRDKGRLDVISTANAEPPFIDGRDVLLACDVREHAYYLDFQNRRPDYVDTFLDRLVNWKHVGQRMGEPTTALPEFV